MQKVNEPYFDLVALKKANADGDMESLSKTGSFA